MALTMRDAIAKARADALAVANSVGAEHVRRVLEAAAEDLEKRLAATLAKGGKDTFTAAQLQATLVQVRAVLAKIVVPGIKDAVLAGSDKAAESAGTNTYATLESGHAAFAGTLAEPLAVKEAMLVDAATQGARASVLRRLASSGEPVANADAAPAKAKVGVLQRYGIETIGHFERVLQQAVLTRQPVDEVRERLVEKSPFLEGAPRYWAERIARTELHAAYNRATWEAGKKANEELGDLVRILSATFDDRTGSDSIAVHGQVRRMEEPFDWWEGPYMHPPNRPNDREIVVEHRISWGAPPEYLRPRPDAEVAARWKAEGRKGSPPPRPQPMSTVDESEWGQEPPEDEEAIKAAEEEKAKAEAEEAQKKAEEEAAAKAAEEAAAKAKAEEEAAEAAAKAKAEEEAAAAKAAEEAAKAKAKAEEEEAKKKNPKAIALAELDGMSGGTDTVDIPYGAVPTGEMPWLDGLTDEQKAIVKLALAGDHPELAETQSLYPEDIKYGEDMLHAPTVKKKIEEGATNTSGVICVQNAGKIYAVHGSTTVLAANLLTLDSLDVDVINLDDADTMAKLDALAAKVAKKKAAAAKAKATKAANKAKKEAEKKAAEDAAKAAEEAAKAAEAAAKAAAGIAPPTASADVVMAKQIGPQAGSNPGGLYEGSDGVKRYVKQYDDPAQAHGEQLANAIYNALGIGAPHSAVFERGGRTYHAASIIQGQTLAAHGLTSGLANQVLDGFAADVLLANWDVVGMSQDNLLVDASGRVHRIDNGGTLLMRAKAGRKPPSTLRDISEWSGFFDPSVNPAYRAVALAAGVSAPEDIAERVRDQIMRILELREAYGGWAKFAERAAPGLTGADRDAIVRMLDDRTKRLEARLATLKPKPKPVAQEAVPGKFAPPKIKQTDLAIIEAPKQTPSGTPDGVTSVADYRAEAERQVGRRDDNLGTKKLSLGNLTRDQQRAIWNFTGGSFVAIRDAMSGHDPSLVQADAKRDADLIKEVFAQRRVKPVPGTVYRCMGVPEEVAQTFCDQSEDEPVHLGPWDAKRKRQGNPSISSSSRTMNSAVEGFSGRGTHPILFVINNRRGIAIETISQYEEQKEDEVLTHPDAHYRVTHRSRARLRGKDFLVIHMDELTEHEIADLRKRGVIKSPAP